MSNTIKLKRGTSTPSTSDISNGEVAIDTSAKKLYINDSGTVKEIGGSGTIGGASGLDFNDNVKVRFGTGNDLEIYHDGSHSYIKDTGTGNLNLAGSTVDIINAADSEFLARFKQDDNVELYYDNVKKIETSANGVNLYGTLVFDNPTNAGKDINWLPQYDFLRFEDNVKAVFGNAGAGAADLEIYHSGSHNIIGNNATQLRLITDELRFRSYTGSETYAQANVNGAFEAHYDNVKKFETTSTGVKITGTRTDIDTGGTEDCFRIGNAAGCDTGLRIGSTSTDVDTHAVLKYDKDENWVSLLIAGEAHGVGGIKIENGGNIRADDIVPHSDNAHDLGTSAIRWRDLYISNDIDIEDNGKLLLGDGSDLQIYHDGSNSYVAETGTGDLVLQGGTVWIQHGNGENALKATQNAGVELRYDNVKKFETTSAGVDITGSESRIIGDLRFDNSDHAGFDIFWDQSSKALEFADDVGTVFGAGDDLLIWHDGTDSIIRNTTGDLYIQNSASDIEIAAEDNVYIKNYDGQTYARFMEDGASELYYDDSKKLYTSGNGVVVTALASSGNITLGDSIKSLWGDGEDLQIYHDGSASYLNNTTGDMWYRTPGPMYFLNNWDSEYYAKFKPNNAVELYYDGVNKIQTHPNGVLVNGHLYAVDSNKIILGSDADLEIYHDGGNSWVKDAGTGALYLDGSAIKITHGGATETLAAFYENGAAELWYDGVKTFETTTDGVTVKGSEGGSAFLYVSADEGDDNADKWRHIATVGGQYFLSNYASGGWEHNIGFTGNGSTELYYDNSKKLETFANGIKLYDTQGDLIGEGFDGGFNFTSLVYVNELRLMDSEKIQLGDGLDLQIYHDGSNSRIHDGGTGVLAISGSQVHIQNAAQSENCAKFIQDGAVELYYDNVRKFRTTAEGAIVDGSLYIADNKHLILNDANKAKFGNGEDLQIYHDGSNSYINNTTGILRIRDSEIRLCNTDNETYFMGAANGAAKLYYDDAVKFETTTTGVSWGTTRLRCDDNGMIELGTSQDLQIYHNGTNSLIENGTGELLIRAKTSENSINCNPDAGTEIFYDNSKKFETQDTGVKVYGDYFTNDGNKINLGGSNDLQIYHDGSHSYIKDSGTGDLVLQASTARIINAAATENIARFFENGSCELYYDNGKRLGTTSAGISINRQNAGEYFNVNANYGGSGDQAIEVSGDLTFYTNATSIAARLDQDGLKFNADTAAANALGDYETGTFSLVMNPGGNSYSVSHMQAQYTKVGNVCHIQGWWRCSTAHSVSGSLTVQGFPFAAYNNTGSGGLRQTLSAQVANANGNATDIVIQLNDNATTGTIKSTTNMGAGRYEWVATNIEDTTAVYINGSYLTT